MSDIDLALGDGRFGLAVHEPLTVGAPRPLTEADLSALAAAEGEATKPPPLKQLRQRHHQVARLLAQGLRPTRVAALTGYSVSRISILQNDPAFQELLASYADDVQGEWVDQEAQLVSLSSDAMAVLADKLEDEPEAFTPGTLIEIAKLGADRTGHGPQSKTTNNVNVHVGFGERLRAAAERMKTIEHTPEAEDG